MFFFCFSYLFFHANWFFGVFFFVFAFYKVLYLYMYTYAYVEEAHVDIYEILISCVESLFNERLIIILYCERATNRNLLFIHMLQYKMR